MENNWRTKKYLQEMNAVLVKSEIVILSVDYKTNRALLNRKDTYKKRNNKTCYVIDDNKGKHIKFTNDDVCLKKIKQKSYRSSFEGLEELCFEKEIKQIKENSVQRLISEYLSL